MHFQFHTVDPERPLIYLILFKHMEHDLLCNIEAGLNKASGLFSERWQSVMNKSDSHWVLQQFLERSGHVLRFDLSRLI